MQASRGRDIGDRECLPRVGRVWSPRVSVWALIGIALLAWGKSSEGQGAGPLLRSAVTIEGGKLSVWLREAKVRDVMEAIARQSGIEIIFVGQAAQTTLTESFSGLPLEDGLRRLLRGKSYMLMYSETERESRITKVFVLFRTDEPGEEAGEPPPSIAEVMSEALTTERFAETIKAAITAARGATEEDQASEERVAAELTATLQRLLAERGGTKFLDDRLQR